MMDRISLRPEKMKVVFFAGVILILIGIGFFIGKQTNPGATLADQDQTPAIQVEKQVNKQFSFPVTDSTGATATTISYTITSVDKQNQVIIKGQRASTINGRTFFVIHLTLTNSSTQPIQLNSRDYIRASVGKNPTLFAADLHNDPVVIQPSATEYTSLGFPVDATATDITLHVGEISGTKTDIPIHFK